MKNIKKIASALLLFAVLAGIGYAFTPPPPPPVPQTIGLQDISIDFLVTNQTDQSVCRQCHQSTGTNISGGYNNTLGGVATRHHTLVVQGILNACTNNVYGCPSCHAVNPAMQGGVLLDRSCVDCHNGTAFWGNGIGAQVCNFPRPHHVNTSYASSNIGNPAANRTCKFCHGSFVDDYNDGHYKGSYAADFMITPYASFRVTNVSQPDGLGNQGGNILSISDKHTVGVSPTGGYKTWGGCYSCHLSNYSAIPQQIGSNYDNHHLSILGSGSIGGTGYQTNATPFNLSYAPGGRACFVCHVIDPSGSGGPLELTLTNTFVTPNQILVNAMELRDSTIESADALINSYETGTTNITVNGTGCEKCHGVMSLHNIQGSGGYTYNGPQGLGHINNNTDCSGCHSSWLPADSWTSGAIIPTVDTVSPSVIAVGTATTLTITGSNFVNDAYTSVVTVDGVTYTLTSITDMKIVVNIPALSAGVHKLQLVKGGNTLSKLSTLTIVSNPKITSAKLSKGVITITGTNFGTKPATNAQYYVSVKHAGNQIVSTSINSWSNTQIKAKNSAAAIGDIVTVITANSGEAQAVITK